MPDILLNISQVFQMMTLAPCMLVIIFLLFSCNTLSSALIPVFYFLSLSCGLIIPLLPAFIAGGDYPIMVGLLRFGESFEAALSYLLIIQLVLSRPPAAMHYCILAIPAIGGSSYIYAAQLSDDICLSKMLCFPSSYAAIFYNIFSSALIFMLAMIFISRNFILNATDSPHKKHSYWLILSLVIVNLLLLAIHLIKISYHIPLASYVFMQSIINLGFIYLVLSSLFSGSSRVFYHPSPTAITSAEEPLENKPVETAAKPSARLTLTEKEQQLAVMIEELMVNDKIYTNLNLSRTMLAQRLSIKEHQLSSIINLAFKKSFSEYTNYYRIEEAKRLLKEHNHSVTVISFDTGFNSLTSFNRVFKEATGLSPSEYRAKQ
jgi:AraC-like DNA-binding protein